MIVRERILFAGTAVSGVSTSIAWLAPTAESLQIVALFVSILSGVIAAAVGVVTLIAKIKALRGKQ